MPSTGTLKNLTVYGLSSAAYSITVTVSVNGSPTALTCNNTLAVPSVALVCADTGHSVAVNPGDLVTVGFQTTDGTNPLAGTTLSLHASLEKY